MGKKAIKGNVITFRMSLECVDLKIVGTAFEEVSMAVKVQQPNFLFDPIVAHLSSSTWTIQNFDVKVSMNMGPIEVEIAGEKSKIVEEAVNKILKKKKHQIEEKLAQEMAKVLNEKLTHMLSQEIQEMMISQGTSVDR